LINFGVNSNFTRKNFGVSIFFVFFLLKINLLHERPVRRLKNLVAASVYDDVGVRMNYGNQNRNKARQSCRAFLLAFLFCFENAYIQ